MKNQFLLFILFNLTTILLQAQSPKTCVESQCPENYHCSMSADGRPGCYKNDGSTQTSDSCKNAKCPSGYSCSTSSGMARCASNTGSGSTTPTIVNTKDECTIVDFKLDAHGACEQDEICKVPNKFSGVGTCEPIEELKCGMSLGEAYFKCDGGIKEAWAMYFPKGGDKWGLTCEYSHCPDGYECKTWRYSGSGSSIQAECIYSR